MVDARGHGLSEAPLQNYGVDHHAADIAGLIQALGLNKPDLMGHSMGAGTTATVIAHNPGLVRRAVLEDPPWRVDDRATDSLAEREKGAREWSDRIIERNALSIDELIARGKTDNPKWHDLEFGPWSEAKHRVNSSVPNYIVETTTPWRETMAKIETPTLLVIGDADAGAIVTTEVADDIARSNAAIRVAHIEGAGHNIRRDQFEAFVTAVTSFLQT
jgi:pimeloyl-ACP methyl ester carboxylesterase